MLQDNLRLTPDRQCRDPVHGADHDSLGLTLPTL
jgi:hypothetical protein